MVEAKNFEDKFHQTTLWDAIRKLDLEYDFHIIANIFPLMSSDELENLEESFRKNGYLRQYPILLFEGKILDGRNRYFLSQKLKITPFFENFEGSYEEALDFVWSSNHNRRHLSSVQRTLAAQEYHKIQSELAKKRKEATQLIGRTEDNKPKFKSSDPDSESGTDQKQKAFSKGDTRDKIAKKVNVSPHTVDTIIKAVKLEDEAPAIKKLLNKAKKGDKTITVESIRKEVSKIETAKKREEKLEELRKNQPDHQKLEFIPEIYCQDALKFLDSIEERSQDLLFSDPPYMNEIQISIDEFVKQWVPKALEKIKDSGRIFVFTGNYPQEIRAYINVFLNQKRFYFSNILIWTYKNTIGPSTNRKYKNNYQCLFYLYGSEAPPLNSDLLKEKFSVMEFNAPDGRQANNFFKWQKPDDLAERIIRHSTQEGDCIIDPFAGSGTILLKATEMKRYAKGSEIMHSVIDIAIKRGCVLKNGF